MSSLKNKPEDAEDHEIFDIIDFTTASDWERFIVQIEELINEWKLNTNNSDKNQNEDYFNDNLDFENGEWNEKAETIQFADETSFTMTFYSLCPKEQQYHQQLQKQHLEQQAIDRSKTTPPTNNEDDSSSADFNSFLTRESDPSSTKCKNQFKTSAEYEDDNDESNKNNLVNLPPKSMADLLNRTNDFKVNHSGSTTTPSIAYWYGLCKFVVISPTRSSNFIENESKANLLLSSIAIAINNTGCLIPIFVQINASHREMFIGLCEGSALKTHFQIVHFNYVPPQYAYLSGLLEIFKSKLGAHLTNSSLLITISVRFTYLIQENTFLDWQQSNAQLQQSLLMSNSENRPSLDIELIQEDDWYPNIKFLPFGAYQECIDSILLSCVWTNLSEDIIVDSDSFSDLNPLHSNDWSLSVFNICDKCDLQLTNLLNKYVDELKRTIGVNQLLGSSNYFQSATDLSGNTNNANINEELKKSSLQRLSSPRTGSWQIDRVYNLSSNVVEKATYKVKALNINDPNSLPLDKGFLDYIMGYLFPDANLISNTKLKLNDTNRNEFDKNDETFQSYLKRLNLMKSSSNDNEGLLNKLTICLAIVNQIGQTKALAQLWKEFLLELRFRYDSSVLIPGISSSSLTNSSNNPINPLKSSSSSSMSKFNNFQESNNFIPPDLSRCLLHQKLQMLNCCIKKKLERQSYELLNSNSNKQPPLFSKSGSSIGSGIRSHEDSDSDEQFFDCEDESSSSSSKNESSSTTTNKSKVFFDLESSNRKLAPEGRFKKFGDLTLLKNPKEPIYVPITQESTPMTEDMLEQHASVLVNLGSGDDAALLRAKIQSASLLSDMQSFKAANPGCILEDFVRWYSPRDWIENEEKTIDPETNEEKIVKKYQLSNRMKIPGNMWLEVWENANPVPARRQKRLFDDTKEAENVFEWLNSLSIGQIVEQTLPIIFYSAIFTCLAEAQATELYSLLNPTLEVLIDKAIRISRNSEAKKYQDLILFIKSVEQLISLMKSLRSKFLLNKISTNQSNINEIKEFLKVVVKSAGLSDNCEVKIPDGAHGTVGKLITRLSKRKRNLIIKNKKYSNHPHQYELLNEKEEEELNEDELDQQFSPFDRPFKREYILRSSASRPAPYSRLSPQRMYCLLTSTEFRLAGAFTEDTMFF